MELALFMRNEVPDVLIVDLEEGDLDVVLTLGLEGLNLVKKLLHSVVHNSGQSLITKHGKCLTGPSCAVGKNGGVITVEDSGYQELGRLFEHSLRGRLLVEREVEGELLLAGAILPKLILCVFLGKVGWIC